VRPEILRVTRHPLPGWIQATSLNLECLRLALLDRHREAFEPSGAMAMDPAPWMARSLDAQIGALTQTMETYEQADRLADELEDVNF